MAKCRAALQILDLKGDPWEVSSAHYQIAASLCRLGDFRDAIAEDNAVQQSRQQDRSRLRTLGPVSDLERHLPSEWWRTLFNSLYLETDGDIVENDRYPFSHRIRTLRAILFKLRPEPARSPLPPPKVYAPPRARAACKVCDRATAVEFILRDLS